MENNFDIGIIGGGPAGYTVALNAKSEGLSTVLFEMNELGGTCLNKGCIPTKAILHSAQMFKEIRNSADLGINVDNVTVNFEKVMERKNEIVKKLRKMLELSIKNSGTTFVKSQAEIIDNGKIKDFEGNIYNCKKIIVAVGAKPREIKGLEFDNKQILSSDDILNLKKLPESIIIIGSGAIGIEWARIFSNFGVETTIVEMAEHLLPIADTEVSKRLERIFKGEKVKFYLNNCVNKVEKSENKVKLTLKTGEEINSECVLVGVGREINHFENHNATVLGDASRGIQLAHYAIKQALEEIKGIPFNKNLVPSVVYGTPEIAWVGLREQDLEPDNYKKSILPISALGKAQCDNATEGFIKILSKNGKIVGAHIVSNEASALIMEILIAMQNNVPIEKLKEVCFPHPTYSEGIFDSLFKL